MFIVKVGEEDVEIVGLLVWEVLAFEVIFFEDGVVIVVVNMLILGEESLLGGMTVLLELF